MAKAIEANVSTVGVGGPSFRISRRQKVAIGRGKRE
jgi:hypothetical protein